MGARAADLARYYDLDLISDPQDLPFYLDLAGTDPKAILELATGSGRIAIPLAATGHDVTGVDTDAAMLDRARTKWAATSGIAGSIGRLHLIEHDLTQLDLPARFDFVILALNSLLVLDGRAAQERALHVMRAHLAPGGKAAIDVWLPSPDDLELYDGRQVLEWVRTDPETGERIAKTWSATYDAASHRAALSTTFETDAGVRARRQDFIQFTGAEELFDLLGKAGLETRQVLGDYSGTPWSATSERVVLIAGTG